MVRRRRTTKIFLAERALRDISEIEKYSVREFGKRVADRYLEKFETAIKRIGENPDLLTCEPDWHAWLRFYRVEKHMLVCDVSATAKIYVLAVIHASMDIPARLLELEPSLASEIELLNRQLQGKKKK